MINKRHRKGPNVSNWPKLYMHIWKGNLNYNRVDVGMVGVKSWFHLVQLLQYLQHSADLT